MVNWKVKKAKKVAAEKAAAETAEEQKRKDEATINGIWHLEGFELGLKDIAERTMLHNKNKKVAERWKQLTGSVDVCCIVCD